MQRPKVCVLRTAGTNCDFETAFAFLKAGSDVESVHVNRLISGKDSLLGYQILAIPGGFTYGDDIAAGKILANELRCKLAADLRQFMQSGKLIIGICNGFQVLVKAGILPGGLEFKQEVSLIINDSAKFEDRWVYLKSQKSKVKSQKCVWTKGLSEIIYLPVAHGEGKFVTANNSILGRLKENQQIVFQYCDCTGKLTGYPDNPNGSVDNIAGISDTTGRILGMMPHPERHVQHTQHPRWTGLESGAGKESDGLQIFKNGVEYARRNLS